MGHVRLGILPRSRKWRQVVEELRLGSEINVVAASAADAAEAALHGASNDPAFLHAFWLLTQVPLAARGPDFLQDLQRLGVQVPDQPSLMDLVAGISSAIDSYAREQGGRTDLGEMERVAPPDPEAMKDVFAYAYDACRRARIPIGVLPIEVSLVVQPEEAAALIEPSFAHRVYAAKNWMLRQVARPYVAWKLSPQS